MFMGSGHCLLHVLIYEHIEPFLVMFEYNQSSVCGPLAICSPMIILVIGAPDISSLAKQCQA